jgi:hypothetical protein
MPAFDKNHQEAVREAVKSGRATRGLHSNSQLNDTAVSASVRPPGPS